jgi:hypothetical protein
VYCRRVAWKEEKYTMPTVSIGAPRQYTDRGWPAVGATIEIDGHRLDVYYRASQGPLAASAAPFALNALPPAMKLGQPLHIETPLPAAALPLLARAQGFVRQGHPYLHNITIEATTLPSPSPADPAEPDRRGVGIFFSGGVDSFYSLLQHRAEITHVVFVHGFDTLLANPAVRARNVRAMRQAASELGKPMIEIETNSRTQLDAYEHWSHHIALSLEMAIAQVLGLQLKKIYIAENFDSFARWTPAEVAQGFTTGGANVFLDGTECLRVDKTAYIATSDVAMRWLRVCWQSQEQTLNCGHCEKCVRTMVALHLAGALDRYHTFNRGIDLERIHSMRFAQFGHFWPELLLELERRGNEPELAEAIRSSIGWATVSPNSWGLIVNGLEKRGDHVDLLRITRERMAYAHTLGLAREQADRLTKAVQRVLDLEDEIRILKSSQSWKFTAPLRSLGLRLRKRVRR